MEVYNVNLARDIANSHRRARMFFILLAFTAPTFFATEWLWLGRPPISELAGMAIKAILFGLLMSAVMSSRNSALSATKSWSNYQIVVEDGEIKTRNFNSYNRMFSKTIRRGEIRTVIEREQGMLISNRGRVGTSFFGGIWIPKQLADYEDLKRLISGWRAAEASK